MTDEAEHRWREAPRDAFEDLRQRLARVERDQATLLEASREAQDKLAQLRRLIERETRELRFQTAAIILILVVPPVIRFVWSWL